MTDTMDYRSTMHIEFQAETFTENTRLRRKLEEVVERVLAFHGLEGGLDQDAYAGDRETTKGWDSDAPESELAITWLAEEERINGLIDDLEDRGGKFARDDDESPAEREHRMLVAEDVADEETLLAERERRIAFSLRGGDLG